MSSARPAWEGTWEVSIATPIGKQAVVLTLAADGAAVVGTATQGAQTVPIVDGAAVGNRVRWRQQITRPLKLQLAFEVTVDGDAMTGVARAGILPSSKLTGTRRW